MPSTRTPVAMGSRVPACPTFRVPARRRIRPTTSWLVHPCGLSTITSPESTPPSIWAQVGAHVQGTGRMRTTAAPHHAATSPGGTEAWQGTARMAGMPELAAHVRDVPINQIREITEAAWRTPGALVLSIGEPGFPLPRHVLDAGIACLDRDETNYTPNAGIPALREAFAARFREEQGVDVGAVLSEDLVRELVELARRHDIWVISDECYEAFTYDVPHVSPARFDGGTAEDARVFTSLTLSKTYGLTGLRIGALICPPGLGQKMDNVMESIVSCVASAPQYAALAALTGPQEYVRHAHQHYRDNRDAASAVLAAKGIRYLPAQGAFYLWADMSHVTGGDVRSWVRRFLADSGVALAPGTAFGSIGEGWVRIALCGRKQDLLEGLSRLPAASR